MNADAERHRAQPACYIQIAKLMTNETTTAALRARAETCLAKARAIEKRERQPPPSSAGRSDLWPRRTPVGSAPMAGLPK
jgi:hypothetical protein